MAVIGITSARSGDCKRGVAANVAARLAADEVGRIAVVDADPATGDVGDRLGLSVPGRLEWPSLSVIPAARDLGWAAIAMRIERARSRNDIVVVDLPRGCGAPGPTLDARLLDFVDRLVVATDLTDRELTTTARFVELVRTAQARGQVPADLELVAAVVGEEIGGPEEHRDVEARIGLGVVAAVPQWWGRTPPNSGFGPTLGFGPLDAALRSVAEGVAGSAARRSGAQLAAVASG